MIRNCRLVAILCFCVLCLTVSGCSKSSGHVSEPVTLESLLSSMTNAASFAEAPLGRSYLESSYDRTGGNQDWTTFRKVNEHGRIQLLNIEGSGYLSRIWIASFDAKQWLFFFDGEDEARLILTQEQLFGGNFPFVSPLAGNSGGGKYSLLPIPFSKGIRVEIEPKYLNPASRNYFQINYTKIEDAVSVESYPSVLSKSQSNMVEQVNTAYTNLSSEFSDLSHRMLKDCRSQPLLPDQAVSFWNDDSSGILNAFCVKIDSPDPDLVMGKELLRNIRVQLYWNKSKVPSVDVPLGDFFCNPLYTRSFTSLPAAYINGTYICRFPMPYKKGARCVLFNAGKSDVSVSVAAEGDKARPFDSHSDRYFHAVWRATNKSGEPFKMMETSSGGHYVGCMLTAIGQDGSWNILEGDECLRPDPKTEPPQFGTGLEDYFSGAYYYTSLFDLPLHGLIEKGAMRTDQYRFHLLDAVPFEKSFECDIEFGDQNRAQGYMSSVIYWYADKVNKMALSSDVSPLLARPSDRFELAGLMSQLFALERAGLFKDAAGRMGFFANRFRVQRWVDMLRVRKLGYMELLYGFDKVKQEYEELTSSKFQPAAQSARDAIWIHADSTNALLGIHALAKYNLKLDGKEVASGAGQGELRVHRIGILPGTHTWEVDLAPTAQGSFFSLCLRTQEGDITSAGVWDIIDVEEVSGVSAPESFDARSLLPNMTVWAFEPNAYVLMQSPTSLINLWSFWAPRPLVKRVKLRKQWNLSDARKAVTAEEIERSSAELRAHAID